MPFIEQILFYFIF